MGIKHVTKVTVVANEPMGVGFGKQPRIEMHLFFTIEDVPTDKVTKDDPGEQKPGGGELGSTVLHIRNEGRDVVRVHDAVARQINRLESGECRARYDPSTIRLLSTVIVAAVFHNTFLLLWS